jgi:hypothetical protein
MVASTKLKVERVRLANRLRDQLWRYYPQLELGDLDEDWMLDLWEATPTPGRPRVQRAISPVLKKHR